MRQTYGVADTGRSHSSHLGRREHVELECTRHYSSYFGGSRSYFAVGVKSVWAGSSDFSKDNPGQVGTLNST